MIKPSKFIQTTPPSKRVFTAEALVSVKVEIDSLLIEMMKSEEWKKVFYDFGDEEDIVSELIKFSLRETDLSRVDGFYGLPEETTKIRSSNEVWDFQDITEESEEQ